VFGNIPIAAIYFKDFLPVNVNAGAQTSVRSSLTLIVSYSINSPTSACLVQLNVLREFSIPVTMATPPYICNSTQSTLTTVYEVQQVKGRGIS
jgi:hypothetical protein